MVKKILFQRPAWFRHEGYWRIAQVVRLGPSVALALFGLLGLVVGLLDSDKDYSYEVAINSLIGAVVIFVTTHLMLRLIVWIIDGFHPKAG